MMKKKNYFVLFLLLALFAFPTINVKAETLRDYKNKVADLKSKKNENTRLTTDAENKIKAKRNAIIDATNTIEQNENKVEESKALVAESQEQIKIRTEELKDVIDVFQYTQINSQEIFLDYIFGAESITDLIERQAIVEQIVNYTQEELDGLEKLIKENEELQVQLENDNVTLNNSITEHERQLDELDKYIDSLASIGLDYDDQIQAQEGLIKIYQEAGCGDDDDIDICYYSKINGSAYFSRPLNKGKVTQAWNATHGGMDLGGNTPGTNIYAPANGTIVYTKYHYKCGGNIIYMHSYVNGQKYTLEFAHLRSINVSIGQVVTKGTIIGSVGGDSSTWYYDTCTSGAHLHYAISYGYYFTDATWNGFYTFKANTKATGEQSISNLKSVRGWTWSTRG